MSEEMPDGNAVTLGEVADLIKMEGLDGWNLVADGTAIEKEFLFTGFNAAFGFISRVALASENANHHPEWHNVYNRVVVRWTTHSTGGLSPLDFRLARKCDSIFSA